MDAESDTGSAGNESNADDEPLLHEIVEISDEIASEIITKANAVGTKKKQQQHPHQLQNDYPPPIFADDEKASYRSATHNGR